MNAKTVDGLADVSSLILALKALNIERVTFANKPIAVPVLHDSFSVLNSYFVSCYIIYLMMIIFIIKTTYPIPFENWFRITSDGTYKTDDFS
jgi:hypothetical protein